jgi:hypothetical protein
MIKKSSLQITPALEPALQADSISELAVMLGVSRQSVHRWRKENDDTPEPDADGLYDVDAWRLFIEDRGLNQSNYKASDNDSQETADWKEEKVRLECERIAIGNAKLAGTLIEADEAKAALSALLGGLRQAINNVPGRMADKVLHITDHHEAEEIITEEMNVLLKTIAKCDFLEASR